MTDDKKNNGPSENEAIHFSEVTLADENDTSQDTLPDEEISDDEITDDFEEANTDDDFEQVSPKKSSPAKTIIFIALFFVLIGGLGYYFLFPSQKTYKKIETAELVQTPTNLDKPKDLQAPLPPPIPSSGNKTAPTANLPIPPQPMAENLGQNQGVTETVNNGTTLANTQNDSFIEKTIDDPVETFSNMEKTQNNMFPSDGNTDKDLSTVQDSIENNNSINNKNLLVEEENLANINQDNVSNEWVKTIEENIASISAQLSMLLEKSAQEEQRKDESSQEEQVKIISQQIVQINHRLDQLDKKISVAEPKQTPRASPKQKTTKTSHNKTYQWVLRSAQPDVVWLSQDNDPSMKRYRIGDRIPNLGHIKSITQDESGRWIVRAENGVIKQ